jgi:N-acetylglucosamine-6-sulfatase
MFSSDGRAPRGARRARLALGAALLAGALIASCGGAGWGTAQVPDRPNVLVVLTDDQPVGMTSRMPILSSTPGFARFDSYYDNNPLCCPTRATLLSGLYSHHTGVETNLQASRFDDSATLATWLGAAGYETGLFGKYLNNYPWQRGTGYVPPGWDRWAAFTPDASYYDYTLVGEEGTAAYGDEPADYSTDVLAGRVDEFIRGADQPFFAWFAPYAPHAPRTPAPRHQRAFADARVTLPQNFNKVADGAPRWWGQRQRLERHDEQRATRDQWRSLQAVDDAIGRFVETLRAQGELDDTVILFLSDNGYSLGSHRNPWKDCAYEECVHLPLWIRWPGHTDAGQRIGALAGSMDIAPTIAELAGTTPTSAVDGTSLVPLLTGERSSLDRPILLRHVHYGGVAPSFWGLRTERWTYVEYRSGERELYDDEADPHQLRNLAGRRGFSKTERALHRELSEMRAR